MTNDSLDAISENIKALKEQYTATAKQGISDAVAGFLAENEEVRAIQWTQETNYFEGDPCGFDISAFTFFFNSPLDTEDLLDDLDNWDEGFYEYTDFKRDYILKELHHFGVNMPLSRLTEIQLSFGLLSGFLMDIDDYVYLSLFGDHTQVTVTKDQFTEAVNEPDTSLQRTN